MCNIFKSGGHTVKIRRVVTVPKLIKDFLNVPVFLLKIHGFYSFLYKFETFIKCPISMKLAWSL